MILEWRTPESHYHNPSATGNCGIISVDVGGIESMYDTYKIGFIF